MAELAKLVGIPGTWLTLALVIGTIYAGSTTGPLSNLFGFAMPVLSICALIVAAAVTKALNFWAGSLLVLTIVVASVGWYWTAGAYLVAAIIAGGRALEKADV